MVTGGYSGLGLETVRALVAAGARVTDGTAAAHLWDLSVAATGA
ncbi:hypothetical protein OG338_09585 [Streptomyces sp. NBC_00726]